MKKYMFKKGKRLLSPCEPLWLWQPGKFRSIEYTVQFGESIRYSLPDGEQLDWLKGGGISFDLLTNHRNSTMWGFRYNPDMDKVEINAYAHIGGLRTYTPWLAEVAPGETFTVKIYPGEGDIWITEIITASKTTKTQWVIPNKAFIYRRIWAWFGGTLPAPQDVNMFLEVRK